MTTLRRGFTLLEVMIGLALLGVALVVLIRSAAGSIFASQEAQMTGIITDLTRSKMYDIEEKLMKEGFTDTEQSEDGKDFSDEGWPDIKYSYKVIQVELPSFDTLQQMAKGQAVAKGSAAAAALGSGSGSGIKGLPPGVDPKLLGSAGSDALGGFQNSALGGMLSMMGGFGGSASDMASAKGAGMVSSMYPMFQQILKVSIRKVTLTLKWKVLGRDRELTTVAYFTDEAAMDKVLNGMGQVDTTDASGASIGSGSGSSTGGTTTRNNRTGSGSGTKN